MRKTSFYFIGIVVICIVFSCLPIIAHAEAKTSFTLIKSTDQAAAGQRIELTLQGNNMKDVYAYEATVSFNPTVVEFEKAEPQLEGFFLKKVEGNKIILAFTKVGDKPGEQGTGELCKIVFKGKTQGSSQVKLEQVKTVTPDLKSKTYSKLSEEAEGSGGTVYQIVTLDDEPVPEGEVKKFIDLDGYEWARMEIEALASEGIIRGTSDTTFSPGAKIKRADFVCLLVRAFKFTAEVDSNFADVKPGEYYYQEVGIAKKLGIILGTGGNKFRPTDNISRQDMMVIVARAMKLAGMKPKNSPSDLSGFKDANEVAPYAREAVAMLVGDGIILGSNGKINPQGTATRAETAVILYRVLQLYRQ